MAPLFDPSLWVRPLVKLDNSSIVQFLPRIHFRNEVMGEIEIHPPFSISLIIVDGVFIVVFCDEAKCINHITGVQSQEKSQCPI